MADRLDSEVHAVVRTRGSAKTAIIRTIIALVVVGIAVAGFIVWKQMQKFETTDDAQVDGEIYTVSPRVAGQVISAPVEDEQVVKAGDVLVKLDPKDFEVAVAKAKADLADAIANLASSRTDVPITTITTTSTLANARSGRADALAAVSAAEQQLGAAQARLATAEANLRVAQANHIKADQDLARYKLLVDKDEISKQIYDQAVATVNAGQATIDAQKAQINEARQNISAAEKAVDQALARVQQADATVQSATTGPQQIKVTEAKVESSQAKVEQQRAMLVQAELNLQYTTIVAPVTGIVAKKNVEVGNNVGQGQQIMSIVPLEGIWITANFKETQLRDMHVGQPVKITVDAYGREYSAKVLRMAGASGARLSLLPPENATGNYVKVVQRIPVRIALDPGQNEDHLLRPGMSVDASVSVR
jgi:membrane fusion protein (multidrug efflux system)